MAARRSSFSSTRAAACAIVFANPTSCDRSWGSPCTVRRKNTPAARPCTNTGSATADCTFTSSCCWIQQQLEVNVQSAVALPVFVQGRAAGVFFLRTVQGDPQLRSQDVGFANTMAQAAARVLENEERRAAIYRRQISAGVTDVLTGCASLDALDRRVRDEFERARRYSLRFALVVIDVDRLREVNERLGQPAGDRVLAEIGAMMQREIRAPDFVARYGGDEFALILPEPDTHGGRQFVARHTFPDLGAGQGPTLSAGVVAFPHSEVLRPEDLFTQVEAALERGKQHEPARIGVAGEKT